MAENGPERGADGLEVYMMVEFVVDAILTEAIASRDRLLDERFEAVKAVAARRAVVDATS